MAKKLTDVWIQGAKRPGITFDAAATGLGLKVLPGGSKRWVMQLRWPGLDTQSVRNLPGGVYPAMTLAAAREKAGQYYALAKAGTDPFEAEERARAKQKDEAEAEKRAAAVKRLNTFAAAAERYIADRKANRRAEADAREIRGLLISEWGERPIHEITPDDVHALIDQIKRRTPYGARAAWGHAVGIFKFAVHGWYEHGEGGQRIHIKPITVSPCASLDRRQLFKGAKIGPRQRVLSDEEVFAFWRASGRLGYPAGAVYRLLLLTGCRLNEIADARWSELHPELRRALRDAGKSRGGRVDWAAVPAAHKLLVVARERFKSDAEHAVPLTDAACAVLEGVPRFAKSDHIFTITGNGPAWIGDKYKKQLDARMLRTLRALARRRGDDPPKKLQQWNNHDLRRVVRTALAGLHHHDGGPEIQDHVCELVLGHARKGLQKIYDQSRYATDIRNALERWAARLREIAEPVPSPEPPANVVRLRRRAR